MQVLPTLALVGGLALGTLLGGGLFSASLELTSTIGNSAQVARAAGSSTTAQPAAVPLDTEDNTRLLERAESALESLKAKDYTRLSLLIHPERGLTLTPFSTVSAEYDRTMSNQQVSALAEDQEIYVRVVKPGSGYPIIYTNND